MRISSYLLGIPAFCLLFTACVPAPLDIEPQPATRELAIASTVVDSSTLLLTATYSLNSLLNLTNGAAGQDTSELVSSTLADGATVLLRSAAGTDTLAQLLPGIYGSVFLNLRPYERYTLQVLDATHELTVTSSCTYLPPVKVQELVPKVTRTATDTTVRLHVSVQDDPARTDYFLMSYSRTNPERVSSSVGQVALPNWDANAAKKLELFTDAEVSGGQVSRDFLLDANGRDTLYVHVGRIEKGYYEFLTAYKRTGSLLNQLTNEPITLPTNVRPGLGYFSLYAPTRAAFSLERY